MGRFKAHPALVALLKTGETAYSTMRTERERQRRLREEETKSQDQQIRQMAGARQDQIARQDAADQTFSQGQYSKQMTALTNAFRTDPGAVQAIGDGLISDPNVPAQIKTQAQSIMDQAAARQQARADGTGDFAPEPLTEEQKNAAARATAASEMNMLRNELRIQATYGAGGGNDYSGARKRALAAGLGDFVAELDKAEDARKDALRESKKLSEAEKKRANIDEYESMRSALSDRYDSSNARDFSLADQIELAEYADSHGLSNHPIAKRGNAATLEELYAERDKRARQAKREQKRSAGDATLTGQPDGVDPGTVGLDAITGRNRPIEGVVPGSDGKDSSFLSALSIGRRMQDTISRPNPNAPIPTDVGQIVGATVDPEANTSLRVNAQASPESPEVMNALRQMAVGQIPPDVLDGLTDEQLLAAATGPGSDINLDEIRARVASGPSPEPLQVALGPTPALPQSIAPDTPPSAAVAPATVTNDTSSLRGNAGDVVADAVENQRAMGRAENAGQPVVEQPANAMLPPAAGQAPVEPAVSDTTTAVSPTPPAPKPEASPSPSETPLPQSSGEKSSSKEEMALRETVQEELLKRMDAGAIESAEFLRYARILESGSMEELQTLMQTLEGISADAGINVTGREAPLR